MDKNTLIGGGLVILGGITLLVVFAFIGAFITAAIVNYLFSPSLLLFIFGVTKFTFWKAFAYNLFLGGLKSIQYSSSKK